MPDPAVRGFGVNAFVVYGTGIASRPSQGKTMKMRKDLNSDPRHGVVIAATFAAEY